MRTNEQLWERVKAEIMQDEVAGTKAGQWSARKAQLAVKRYKDKGGTYTGQKAATNALVKWTKQDWTTKSGQPSHVTGERYLPRKAIESLSAQQYASTSRTKRKGFKQGKQFVKQPHKIAEFVKQFRS